MIRGEVEFRHGGKLTSARTEVLNDTRGVGNGRETAGFAQAIVRQSRMHGSQFRQRLADRRLADAEIVVIWPFGLLRRGHGDAEAQARGHQRENHRHLVFAERPNRVVAASDETRGADRIDVAQRGVGHRDREVVDRLAEHHVAEIHDAGDP